MPANCLVDERDHAFRGCQIPQTLFKERPMNRLLAALVLCGTMFLMTPTTADAGGCRHGGGYRSYGYAPRVQYYGGSHFAPQFIGHGYGHGGGFYGGGHGGGFGYGHGGGFGYGHGGGFYGGGHGSFVSVGFGF